MLRPLFVCTAVIGMMCASLRAQALIDSVPPDAIVYIGWSGSASMPPAYEQSNLKAILDASQFRQLITESLPRLAKLIEREEPDAAPIMTALAGIAEPMWKHPTAIYFGGLDMTNPRQPTPRLAVLIDAGDQAAALAANLQQQVARLGPSPIPVTVADSRGVVALVVGSLTPVEGEAASLGRQEKFTAALGQVRKEGIAHVYIDLEALWSTIDALVATEGEDDLAQWATVRDALNLKGIQRIAYSGSFDGPDWRDDFFIQVPAPRTGIAALLDSQPLANDMLSVIPQDATLAMAGRGDLSRILQEVRTGLQKANPEAAAKMEEGLAEINGRLDMDLEKDLLDPLGDQWAFYAAQGVGGDGLMGFVVVNKLDDAARVDQSLWQLSQLANEAMQGFGEGNVSLAFKQFERDGLKVNYFAIPVISPAWAVQDGNLYIGLYPQVVVAAAGHVKSGGPGLAQNAKFQAVRQRLGDQPAGWVEFYDMEQRVPAGYASMLMFMRLYLGMGDLFGMQTPAMAMPPLNVIMRHISPAGGVSWADDQGFHARYIQPFPLSTSLATSDVSSTLVSNQALMISILLPSLNRARETANRVKCASNMRQIGQASLLYSNENRQRMPADLGSMLKTQDIGIEVFLCPSSNNSIPHEIRTGTIDQMAAWVNDNASYVWLVPDGLTSNLNPELVLMHERIDNHDRDGMNLLYADGHVEFQHRAMAEQEIEKSKREFEQLVRQRRQR